MPKHNSHVLFNFLMLIIMFILYQKYMNYITLTSIQLTFFLFAYFIGTIFINPDLDIKNSYASRKCGLMCKPLTSVSKHRGLQHHWLYGVFLRIIYIIMIISFLLALFYGMSSVSEFINVLLKYKIEMLSIVGGLFLSNLFHVILDTIT